MSHEWYLEGIGRKFEFLEQGTQTQPPGESCKHSSHSGADSHLAAAQGHLCCRAEQGGGVAAIMRRAWSRVGPSHGCSS